MWIWLCKPCCSICCSCRTDTASSPSWEEMPYAVLQCKSVALACAHAACSDSRIFAHGLNDQSGRSASCQECWTLAALSVVLWALSSCTSSFTRKASCSELSSCACKFCHLESRTAQICKLFQSEWQSASPAMWIVSKRGVTRVHQAEALTICCDITGFSRLGVLGMLIIVGAAADLTRQV